MNEKVGIVVPTIGQRPEYLPAALKSIREAGDAYILLVGKMGFDASDLLNTGLIDKYLDEQDASLSAKINYGFKELPREIRFINWLGDDDLLTPGSLDKSLERITQRDSPVLVFGRCEYIGPRGSHLFTNKSGPWAVPLLRFGPQLIPQPGALYSRATFEQIGGLSKKYELAFDFELFYELSLAGKAVFIPEVLAKFRWHSNSLSVSKRKQSVCEASRVRVSHLPRGLSFISPLWEYPVRSVTYLAGVFATNRLKYSLGSGL
jgi:hypothetical protein